MSVLQAREYVYVGTKTDVYHTRRDCRDGPADPTPVARGDVDARICERCRYATVPALEDHDD